MLVEYCGICIYVFRYLSATAATHSPWGGVALHTGCATRRWQVSFAWSIQYWRDPLLGGNDDVVVQLCVHWVRIKIFK